MCCPLRVRRKADFCIHTYCVLAVVWAVAAALFGAKLREQSQDMARVAFYWPPLVLMLLFCCTLVCSWHTRSHVEYDVLPGATTGGAGGARVVDNGTFGCCDMIKWAAIRGVVVFGGCGFAMGMGAGNQH